MPITVHEIGPDGQLVQTTMGDDAPAPDAAPAAAAAEPPGDSAPPAPETPAAPSPSEEAPPDSAPDSPTSPEPTEEEDDEPVTLTKGVQRRIDRLTRQREEARRAQAALEERLRMLEQGYQRPEPVAPASPPAAQSADRADYATDEDWIQAVTQQAIAREREQWQLEQLRQRQALEQQERDAQWATREQTFKQQHPDYEQRLQEVLPRLSPQLRQGLGDSEMAPELAYHLARHPDELQRLNTMQPLPLSRALGRLEQQLTVPSRPSAPPPTAKPAPPTPLNGAGSPGPRLLTDLSDAEIESLSLAEYDALYKRQFPRSR